MSSKQNLRRAVSALVIFLTLIMIGVIVSTVIVTVDGIDEMRAEISLIDEITNSGVETSANILRKSSSNSNLRNLQLTLTISYTVGSQIYITQVSPVPSATFNSVSEDGTYPIRYLENDPKIFRLYPYNHETEKLEQTIAMIWLATGGMFIASLGCIMIIWVPLRTTLDNAVDRFFTTGVDKGEVA